MSSTPHPQFLQCRRYPAHTAVQLADWAELTRLLQRDPAFHLAAAPPPARLSLLHQAAAITSMDLAFRQIFYRHLY